MDREPHPIYTGILFVTSDSKEPSNGKVVSAIKRLDFVSEFPGSNTADGPVLLTEISRCFPQFFQANMGIIGYLLYLQHTYFGF
jgi:hypothetical protein